MLEKLRNLFEPLFRNIAKYISVNPNILTIASLLTSVSCPLIIAIFKTNRTTIIVVTILFIVAAFLDAVDGAVARVYGRVSKVGAFLDSTCDRYVDAIMILTAILMCRSFYSTIFLILTLIGSYITSYSRARGESLGLQLRGVGIVERAERVLLLIIFFIVSSVIYGSKIFNIFATYYTLILAILTNITAIQRIVTVCRMLK